MNFFLFHSYPLLLSLSLTPIMAWDWRGRTASSSQSMPCSSEMQPSACSNVGSGPATSTNPSSTSSACPTTTSSSEKTLPLCPFQSKLFNTTSQAQLNETESQGVCWEAMMYKELDLSNVTAVYQPGYWEQEYASIKQFCSTRGNGTFCYAAKGEDECLAMAVVRCPEGILSSCRAGFMCQELLSTNMTCSISSMNQTKSMNQNQSNCTNSYVESGRAACWAIPDVLQLPQA